MPSSSSSSSSCSVLGLRRIQHTLGNAYHMSGPSKSKRDLGFFLASLAKGRGELRGNIQTFVFPFFDSFRKSLSHRNATNNSKLENWSWFWYNLKGKVIITIKLQPQTPCNSFMMTRGTRKTLPLPLCKTIKLTNAFKSLIYLNLFISP